VKSCVGYKLHVATQKHEIIHNLWAYNKGNLRLCRNRSFGLATKAKGLQGCGPKGRKPGSQGKGIARLRAKRKEARELRQEEARESHHILPRV